MNFRRTVSYKLKHLVPMAMITTMPFVPSACLRVENEPAQTRDIDIGFTPQNVDVVLSDNTLQYYATDESIRAIYLVPGGNWDKYTASDIHDLSQKIAALRANITPKITGRGNFNFKPGEASRVPNDSLWIVRNGWTINHNTQGKAR